MYFIRGRSQIQVQHKDSLLDRLLRALKLSKPRLVGLMGAGPSQSFTGPAVDQISNPIKLLLAVARQISAFGQELANQSVGVLVGSPLPRAVRITEVHGHARIGGELLVVGHFLPPVIGHGLAHGLGYCVEFVAEGLQHVRSTGRIGVGQLDQYQQARAALHQGAHRTGVDLHMAEDLKNTGKGNLFVIFGEPDIDILEADGNQVRATAWTCSTPIPARWNPPMPMR